MNYVEYQYVLMIQDLGEFKEVCVESKDLDNLKNIKEDIKIKQAIFDQEVANMPDEEIEFAVEDFKEYKNKQVTKYYHSLCAYFQRAYAIFENQVQYIQDFYGVENPKTPGDYIDFSKYPIINETNKAINVLKHRKGYSYNKLEESGSKYLDKSELFEDSNDSLNSSIILNIEKNDIIKFLDEAQRVWSDKLKSYRAEKAKKSSASKQDSEKDKENVDTTPKDAKTENVMSNTKENINIK